MLLSLYELFLNDFFQKVFLNLGGCYQRFYVALKVREFYFQERLLGHVSILAHARSIKGLIQERQRTLMGCV